MPTIEQLMEYWVINNYVGRRRPITARALAINFGVSDGGVEVAIRNIIRLAINDVFLIGSNNRGFYMINDINDLNRNLISLRSRAQGILLRRDNMKRNWNENNPNNQSSQPNLEISDR